MADNPYTVQVVNPMQALLLGQQAYDTGQKRQKEAAIEDARSTASQQLAAGDHKSALSTLLGAGDYQGANLAASQLQNQWTQQHTAQQDAVNQQHWNADFGLKQRASNRADEDTFSIEKATAPDGSTYFTRIKKTGAEGPIQGATPPNAQAAGPALTGPEYLATLPPDQATIVKKIADHEIDPNKLSILGGHRERLLAAASRYDPEYDASLAPARFAAKKEFLSGGPNSPAATIVSGGTTIGHLLHASDVSQKLGGPDSLGPLTGPVNMGMSYYKELSNNPDAKEYNTTTGRIAEEGTKFYRGVGGTESDIARDIKTMGLGQSQESRDRALGTQAALIYSKVAALQDRYKNAMGTRAWEKIARDNNFPVISAKNTQAVNTILQRAGMQPLPAPVSGQGNGADTMLQHARDAIAQGAPRDAVLQRLQQAGIDASGL